MKSILVILLMCVCLGYGCDFRRIVVNQPIAPETLKSLSPGESTLQDVVRVLGAPDSIGRKQEGMVFRYRYGDTKTLRVNFGWLFRFLIPVTPSMNVGRGERATQVLHVAMNQDGTLERYMVQDPPEAPSFSFWPF